MSTPSTTDASPVAPVRLALDRMTGYAEGLLGDFPEDRWLWRPGPDMNHAAWLVSHLAIYPDFVLESIGRGDLAQPRDGAAERYGHGSPCTDDPAEYPSRDEGAAWFLERHRTLSKALEDLDPDVLAHPYPDEARRASWPTVGAGLVFMACTHPPIHLGQISMLRRLAGRPRLF